MSVFFLASLFFLALSPLFSQISISGVNEAQFIKLYTEKAHSNYFHNETNLLFNYRNIDFGLSFYANYPKYDRFESPEDLDSKDISYSWDELYVRANLPHLDLRAGSFTEYFGNGLLLRSFRDKNLNIDKRLNGLNTKVFNDVFSLKGFYASILDENYNTVGGLDLSSNVLTNLNLGLSFLSTQERRIDGKYRSRIAGSARMTYFNDFLDLEGEYAGSKIYRNPAIIKGDAIYGLVNSYLGSFTVTTGYKKYRKMNHFLNDLPTLNASDEPLSEKFEPGYDEEGIMGALKYSVSYHTELYLNYSEAWSSDFKVRQSDLLITAKKEFDDLIITAEYGQIELLDKDWNLWEKSMTPAISFDFPLSVIATHLRTQYQKREKSYADILHNPLLQSDFSYGGYGISILSETEFKSFSEMDKSKYWLGIEVKADIFSHSNFKLFVGSEKGGKICRNGVCYYTAPFDGIRAELTTRF